MGLKLVAISDNRRSSRLTEEAQILINHFEKLERELEILIRLADQDFQKLIRNDAT